MSGARLGHRGRLLAAAVAAVLTLAAVVVAGVATASQQHAASPPLSAADPSRERTLAPSASSSPSPPQSISTPSPQPDFGPILSASTPISLDVPRLGIHHANLVQLGQAKDGSIEVPPLGANSPAGWYRNSPTPGQLGASVILGHVDSAAAGPAIFYRLGTLRAGDTVMVVRADHTVAVFVVDSVEMYAKANFPTLQVYGDTDHAALRLITCGGAFNYSERSYEDNIVVYAHLASSHSA